MKKFGIALLMGIFLAIGINAAHADAYGDGFWDGMSSSTLMSSMMGMKEGYVNEVQDEAADYVGADGQIAAGAELEEMIQKIRTEHPNAKDLTDLEISREILKINLPSEN